jgi:hypothetical protein
MTMSDDVFNFFSKITREQAEKGLLKDIPKKGPATQEKQALQPQLRQVPSVHPSPQAIPHTCNNRDIDLIRKKNIEEIRSHINTPAATAAYQGSRTLPLTNSAFPNSRMREEGSPSSKPMHEGSQAQKLPSSSSSPDLSIFYRRR